MDAQVVYEQHDDYERHAGPWGFMKVGVRFADRVIWLGVCGSGMGQADYDKAERLAREIVRRWQAAPAEEGAREA